MSRVAPCLCLVMDELHLKKFHASVFPKTVEAFSANILQENSVDLLIPAAFRGNDFRPNGCRARSSLLLYKCFQLGNALLRVLGISVVLDFCYWTRMWLLTVYSNCMCTISDQHDLREYG